MTRLQLRAIGMVLSLAANLATAGESHYNCVVLSATELSEDGKLVSSALVKSQIGEQFTVDRLTGRVLGGPLDNSHMTVDVIDRGSAEMSFRAFSHSRNAPVHSSFIQVNQYVEATTKPFVGTTTLYYSGVYSGKCE